MTFQLRTDTYLPRLVNVVCERPLVSLFGSRNDVPNLPKVLTFGSSNYPLPAGGSAAPRHADATAVLVPISE